MLCFNIIFPSITRSPSSIFPLLPVKILYVRLYVRPCYVFGSSNHRSFNNHNNIDVNGCDFLRAGLKKMKNTIRIVLTNNFCFSKFYIDIIKFGYEYKVVAVGFLQCML
jgi:hypothetical protein